VSSEGEDTKTCGKGVGSANEDTLDASFLCRYSNRGDNGMNLA
jgi:hypothetical protein